MPRIQQLSTQVINKIAAGEVIERPASVVKELLENAVDAGATRIDVDIEEGGAELIRITDNGCGIDPDDFPLAVASHATSKLREADDLFRVMTMGFRGEALASISEVSRFRIRSRTPEGEAAHELTVDAGKIGTVKPTSGAVGTQIEVRELFCSVPVRRKFMKRASTEFGHISEQFTRVALANPRLHLTLRHNGKSVFELPPCERLVDRLALFFGRELAESLIWVENAAGVDDEHLIRMWGYVAPPSFSHNTRKQQYLFLNGRWFQDRSLQHALGEAYRGLLMVGRQPIGFLFLEMPAEMVDVNVHPAKSEVRFVDSSNCYRLLLSTLRTKFLTLDFKSKLDADKLKPDVTPEKQLEMRVDFADWAKDALAKAPSPSTPPLGNVVASSVGSIVSPEVGTLLEDRPRAGVGTPVAELIAAVPHEADAAAGVEHEASADRLLAPTERLDAAIEPQRERFEPATFRALQVHDTYLVVETGEGLTVIDQHALHERIMYETLRRRVLAGDVEVQKMLIPTTVELAPREAATLADHAELLAELGLEIEQFGNGTVLLSSLPPMLAKADPAALLREVAEQLESSAKRTERRDLIDSLLHMMSCKAAIKAGQRLKPEEIDALLAQRDLIDDSHHCPHGRPTALTLSRDELDRQFGRLG